MAGDHKCPVCQATFTRPQHVARHMRSHTGDRPYKCQHCGDKFARSDLLSRHVNKCHSSEKNGKGRGKNGQDPPKLRCDQCIPVNAPCNSGYPCNKCSQRRIQCSYTQQQPLPSLQLPVQVGETSAGANPPLHLLPPVSGFNFTVPSQYQLPSLHGAYPIVPPPAPGYTWPSSGSLLPPNADLGADSSPSPNAPSLSFSASSAESSPQPPHPYTLNHDLMRSYPQQMPPGWAQGDPKQRHIRAPSLPQTFDDYRRDSQEFVSPYLAHPVQHPYDRESSPSTATSRSAASSTVHLNGSDGAPSDGGYGPAPPSRDGTFSSAFGLMSLDDPAVLAGLAADGAPFFSNATLPPQVPQFLPPPVPASLLQDRPGLTKSLSAREAEIAELREFWKTYMRTPLTGSTPTANHVNRGEFPLGVPPSRRPSPPKHSLSRMASLPSIRTPSVELTESAVRKNEHAPRVMDQYTGIEDLRSYEAAILANKPPQLSLGAPAKKAAERAGATMTSPAPSSSSSIADALNNSPRTQSSRANTTTIATTAMEEPLSPTRPSFKRLASQTLVPGDAKQRHVDVNATPSPPLSNTTAAAVHAQSPVAARFVNGAMSPERMRRMSVPSRPTNPHLDTAGNSIAGALDGRPIRGMPVQVPR